LGNSNYGLEWTFFWLGSHPFVFPFYRVWTEDAIRKNAGSGGEGGAANTPSTVSRQWGRGLLEGPDDRVISTTTHAPAAARLLELRNQILSSQAACCLRLVPPWVIIAGSFSLAFVELSRPGCHRFGRIAVLLAMAPL
jgi:hypothetical protein